MTTAAEYHQFAKECLTWAAQAQSEEQRKAFLDMARAWTEAALRLDGVLSPKIEDTSPPKLDGAPKHKPDGP